MRTLAKSLCVRWPSVNARAGQILCVPTKYKELIEKYSEFKTFYINYLEKNWVIIKERNEISLIIDDATTRYENFIKNNPNIENRIAQHHIANHLGITPTQLSRIRKKIKSQHM